jgi:hypothetical protein
MWKIYICTSKYRDKRCAANFCAAEHIFYTEGIDFICVHTYVVEYNDFDFFDKMKPPRPGTDIKPIIKYVFVF